MDFQNKLDSYFIYAIKSKLDTSPVGYESTTVEAIVRIFPLLNH